MLPRSSARSGVSRCGSAGWWCWYGAIATQVDQQKASGNQGGKVEDFSALPLREAVTRALSTTGTTITSAGLVLGGTFLVLTVVAGSGSQTCHLLEDVLGPGRVASPQMAVARAIRAGAYSEAGQQSTAADSSTTRVR